MDRKSHGHQHQVFGNNASEVFLTRNNLPAPIMPTPSSGQEKAAWWVQALQHQPLMFWGGIWLVLFLITGVAILGLISPQLSKRDIPARATATNPRTYALNQGSGTLPGWSLGAIALTCAVGSMVISQRLKLAEQSHKPLKPQHSNLQRIPVHAADALALPVSPKNLMPQLPPAARQPKQPPVALTPTPEESIVTVVPADEPAPLDWQGKSLADLMDIRYRRQFPG